MTEYGLYKIKDIFFTDFPNTNHMQNKYGRPFYYTIKDTRGIYWLIPLSSRTESYRAKISAEESKRGKGKCMLFHIGYIAGQERVFKICDMIPVSDNYIESEFLLNGMHYVVKDSALNYEVRKKAKNFIKQLELGRMHSQINALDIRDRLFEQN